MSATFKVTSGPAVLNGDLVGAASWKNQASGGIQTETAAEKVRNVSPVRVNEFRFSAGPPIDSTNSFIELYDSGDSAVDISNWTLTVRPAQKAISSAVKIPAGTKLRAHGFYLLGLSDSGLAAATRAGDATVYVRNTDGMTVGDTISIGAGPEAETRKIASVGTAAAPNTTVWQPLPEGPVITIPAGSTNVPVTSVNGFKIGEKIALGYGASYPAVARSIEKYEVATVTAVGKPGTQTYLGADAAAGSTNIKVTSVADISVGDKIRLDIDSVGHGIETVTVAQVGTQATRTNLVGPANAGATSIRVRRAEGFAVGDKINIGTPATMEAVTVTAVAGAGRGGASLDFTPALVNAHIGDETVMDLGTGLGLAAPLKFNHAANLPFSDRGTGISFEPATAFAHSSNEPVEALGTGITLSSPLAKTHAIDAVVQDAAVTTAGYQGSPAPDQWFGGPELASSVPYFDHIISRREGSMVLRDATGAVVDSLNYGLLADPWAAEGFQAVSGPGKSGCFVTAPGEIGGFGQFPSATAVDTSAGRFPDGADTGSNCADFATSPSTRLASASEAGTTNIKVVSVEGFDAIKTIRIGTGANLETAEIATVGTAGATTQSAETAAGATEIPVANGQGFNDGQTIDIGNGADSETAVIVRVARFPTAAVTVSAPLTKAHPAGTELSGTGITLTAPLTQAHESDATVTGSVATPGAPNHYERAAH